MQKSIERPIDALMQKEMSRKEFITALGIGLLSLAGLSTILRLLGYDFKKSSKISSVVSNNSGAYGGNSFSN
jgi:hypothetical protein